MPSSPRSIEACLRLGVDPELLRFRPLQDFMAENEGDTELANLAYGHHETMRKVGL